MTTQFPALEATLIRPQGPVTPSMERPRLIVDGEILPALYHYAVRVECYGYAVEASATAQHEIEAAEKALSANESVREHASEIGSVIVVGVDQRGRLGEYPVTIRVDQDGAVAIPP